MSALEMLNKISQDAKDDIESDDSASDANEEFLSENEGLFHSVNLRSHKDTNKTPSSIISVEGKGSQSMTFDASLVRIQMPIF